MIVITDINARTEILNVKEFGHTPWTMWGRLADDQTAYSMNYRSLEPEVLAAADLIVMRVEESVYYEGPVREGFLKVLEYNHCPKLAEIEGDMNGFRNWQMHQPFSELLNDAGVRMVSRDPRIVPYLEAFYPGSFFFASIFEVHRIKALMERVKKERLIFVPYSTHIRGDRNGPLSAILAHDLAKKHKCKVVMVQSDHDDAMFCFRMGLDSIIALPFLSTMDYLTLIAQSQLCVNLDTIPGFGKVGVETACCRTFHLGTGTCGVTHFVWEREYAMSYLEYEKLFELGDAILTNPKCVNGSLDEAYARVNELDISVGNPSLKAILGVTKL